MSGTPLGHPPDVGPRTPPDGPLCGRRVLLTRLLGDDPLTQALQGAGARVDAVALTRQVAGPPAQVERAQRLLRSGWAQWLVVTSPRTPRFLGLAPPGASRSRLLPGGLRLAAVGARSARALSLALGHGTGGDVSGPADAHPLRGSGAGGRDDRAGEGPPTVDVVGTGGAEELLEALREAGVGTGTRVLLPQSAIARPLLAEGLRALGAEVEAPALYTTVTAPAQAVSASLRRAWQDGRVDVVVLTSGSAAQALVELLGARPGPARPWPAVVTIGPPSARAAREQGLPVAAVAAAPTPEAVLAAVAEATGPGRGDHRPPP